MGSDKAGLHLIYLQVTRTRLLQQFPPFCTSQQNIMTPFQCFSPQLYEPPPDKTFSVFLRNHKMPRLVSLGTRNIFKSAWRLLNSWTVYFFKYQSERTTFRSSSSWKRSPEIPYDRVCFHWNYVIHRSQTPFAQRTERRIHFHRNQTCTMYPQVRRENLHNCSTSIILTPSHCPSHWNNSLAFPTQSENIILLL